MVISWYEVKGRSRIKAMRNTKMRVLSQEPEKLILILCTETCRELFMTFLSVRLNLVAAYYFPEVI
jgi:hypothetical protein